MAEQNSGESRSGQRNTIRNFTSIIGDEALRLECFGNTPQDDHIWILYLYPNGKDEASKGYLSFLSHYGVDPEPEFLWQNLEDDMKRVPTIVTHQEFNIHNDKLKKYKTMEFTRRYENNHGFCGSQVFLERDLLLNEENRLLPNGTLTLSWKCTWHKIDDTPNIPMSIDLTDMPKAQDSTGMPSFEELANRELDVHCRISETRFSDVTLVTAGGREFPAHKLILSLHSTVFSAMFHHKTEEQERNRVEIDDIDEDAIQEMLRFIYTGKVVNLEKVADSLLAAADKYNIESLKMTSQKSLNEKLSTDNVFDILELADLHKAEWLKERAVNFIKEKRTELINSQPELSIWAKSHPDLMVELLLEIGK